MTDADIVAAWRRTRDQLREAGLDALTFERRLSPNELDAYEEIFWRRGFELRGALRQLLETVGVVGMRGVRERDGWAVGKQLPGVVSDLHDLDDHDAHLELAELAGVPNAEHWIIFATDHGDVEPAWAFDHRFRSPDGGYGVGSYHQDLVCTDPVGDDASLPRATPSFASWFVERLDELAAFRAEVPEDEMRAELAKARAEETAERTEENQRRSLAAVEHRARTGALKWGHLSRDWGLLTARTRDVELLMSILDNVRRDRQLGRPGVNFSAIGEGAQWPYDYPGPAALVERLDVAQRQTLMAWALERVLTEVTPAVAALRSGTSLRRTELRALCFAGWEGDRRIDLASEDGRRRYACRTQALALATPSVANVERVLAMAARLGAPSQRFSLLTAWEHLDRFLRGNATLGHTTAATPPRESASDSAIVRELNEALASHSGPQRALLDDVKHAWSERLQRATYDDRVAAVAALRRTIKSPKLHTALDALASVLLDE